MGTCTAPKEAKSATIDEHLKEYKKKDKYKVRLLILGPGESGKSTFIRQMKIVHYGGLDKIERERAANVLRCNLLEIFLLVLEKGGRKILKKTNKALWSKVENLTEVSELNAKFVAIVVAAWQIPDFQQFVKEQYIYQNYHSNASYLFENAERISDADFYPSDQEILQARNKTTGMQEIEFNMTSTNKSIVLVDFGGQRSERRKWINYFAEVHAVIFIVAVDEYNIVLSEDGETYRLKEALDLFASMSAEFYLQKKKFILFLNKFDLFIEKLPRVPLDEYVEGLSRENATNVNAAISFVEDMFKKQFQQDLTYLDIYRTCGLDTENCKRVFTSVISQFEHLSLEIAGLV